MKNAFVTSTCLLVIATLVGCNSIPAGGVPVSAYALETSLSGRTWLWKEGGPDAGLYFSPDKKAFGRWKGDSWTSTWSTRDGAFCFRAQEGDRCWAVYEKDGQTYSFSLWQDEYRVPYRWNTATDTVPGRQVP